VRWQALTEQIAADVSHLRAMLVTAPVLIVAFLLSGTVTERRPLQVEAPPALRSEGQASPAQTRLDLELTSPTKEHAP